MGLGEDRFPIGTSSDQRRADLHLHTIHSDGAHSPYEVVHKAKRAGLSLISVADHDHVAGISEAMLVGGELGIEVVPGLELSVAVDDRDIHVLAYFVDTHNEALLEYLEFMRVERMKRAERIVKKLHSINVPLSMDKVLEKAGQAAVGRPHIATALVEEGLAETYHDVFLKYIGVGRPAYVAKYLCSPEEALALIEEAGGLSFLAHPGNSIPEDVLLRFIKAGVDGIEIVHPSHSAEVVAHYQAITSEYYLLESGGSDFHGGPKNDDDALGRFTVPISAVETMRQRLFRER